MSQPIVNAVWRSDLPDFLKRGVAGKLAALADDDGDFTHLTVKYLVDSRYGRERRRLCRQTIKNQLRALERCGFLRIITHGVGRGHARIYSLHPEALTTVQADDPMLRPPHRRTGKGVEGRILVLRRPSRKGDNKGDNEPETPDISPDLADHAQPPQTGPPGGARWQKGQPHRWDAVRTPDRNYKVTVKLAHTYIERLNADAAGIMQRGEDTEGTGIENFKRLVAITLPGQMQNTGQVLAALDSAAYRRRMLGMPVPAYIGTNGQTAFLLGRQQHKGAGHASRMDAR
jgi:hypothetical protein